LKVKTLDKKEIMGMVERSCNEIVELTSKLVQIPSENKPPIGYEKECQKYLEKKMAEINLEIDTFLPTDIKVLKDHPAFLPGRDYTDRPNLVGILKGRGGGKSLILSGHIDVSPLLNNPWPPWEHKPFSGDVSDGKIFGRGSFDMKGGLAAATIAVKILQDAGVKLKGDVILESVVDEEFGGANGTLSCILRGYEADAAIVPEPTGLAICPATRGGKNTRITIKGTAGFPTYEAGEIVNPVYGMSKIINSLKSFERIRKEKWKRHPLYMYEYNPLPIIIEKLKAGEVGPSGALGVPVDCWLEVWIQVYPGVTEEELDKEFFSFMDDVVKMDQELKKNPPTYKKTTRFLYGTEIDINHPIVSTVSDSYKIVTGNEGIVKGAPLACDAFMFHLYSKTPPLIFGPGGGNAHAPNEFVYIKDLITLTKVFTSTIIDWCGLA
jgi:acetylornithine deacetylase